MIVKNIVIHDRGAIEMPTQPPPPAAAKPEAKPALAVITKTPATATTTPATATTNESDKPDSK